MTPGNWSWTDNSTFDFKEWAASQPQNLSMSCASITSQTGLWKSDDCFKTKPYVCAVPVSTTTTSTTSTTTSTTTTTTTPPHPAYMNCSEGWMYFEPTYSCYGVDGYDGWNKYNTDWTDAENYCQSVGAHLVSLHSYEETKFVSTLIEFALPYAWTGLYSNDNEKTWRWSDGSSVDYLPWGSGLPNLNISSCAALLAENMSDWDCTQSFFTVCKKSASLLFKRK
jgi:C-type mannose receptor